MSSRLRESLSLRCADEREAIAQRQTVRRWHELSRRLCPAIVFDFFQIRGLATRRHRHHCLSALRGCSRVNFTRSERRRMYKLYSMQRSGNSYKARLALAFLGAPYRAIEIYFLRG